MKHFTKKSILVLCLLMVTSTLLACSSPMHKSNSTGDDSTIPAKDAIDKENPRLNNDEYIGYLQSISLDLNTLFFDDAELITSENTKRITELKLSDNELQTGFYINNEREISEEFIFDDSVIINLYDMNDSSKMNSYTLPDFDDFMENRTLFCKISIVEGTVYNIVEVYLP